jgi:hypothetical protein
MTEAEWLGNIPTKQFPDIVRNAMIDYLQGTGSARKLRLFACACCRRVWHLLGKVSRQSVLVAERYADGAATLEEVSAARESAFVAYRSLKGQAVQKNAASAPICATEPMLSTAQAAAEAGGAAIAIDNVWGAAHQAKEISYERYYGESEAQNRLLRDIFGNPFRPVTLDPSWIAWNAGAVKKMAQVIYDERRFADLPILADALEDAGCTDPAILSHCREPGEHVRGCWVVDLLLGKT